MIFTGIGSRETPSAVLKEMMAIGAWARSVGHVIYSGHAEGADWGFESNAKPNDTSFTTGAQEACTAFLPWGGFNTQLSSKAKKVTPYPTEFLKSLVDKFHPAPGRLSKGAYSLMLRNGCQIFGTEGMRQSQAVVCWTSDGKASGGTGQAIRIADSHGVPVFNMYHDSFNSASKVQTALQRIIDALQVY
jgi:hypothetical protein